MRGFGVFAIVCCVCASGGFASEAERPDAGEIKDENARWLASATREPSKKIEAAFRNSFNRPGVDPAQAVIRVYGADGKFTVRKVRFESDPRDFSLDLARREEEKKIARSVDGTPLPLPNTVPVFEVYGIDPLLYGPFLVPPDLATTSGCR